ncbi:MAG: hypothetical protein P4L51_10075 [Puia sp.]|nr:hypothetical protein [Puia sp.]
MIHANEIRLGNKVQAHGEVITVQQILSSSLIYDSQIKVSREVSKVRGSYKPVYSAPFVEEIKEADFNEIDPIVLTPKILEKCGFRNFMREEWILKIGNSHYDFEFESDGLRLRHPTPSRIPIQYLHQLQNFLYAIAEYELETEL